MGKKKKQKNKKPKTRTDSGEDNDSDTQRVVYDEARFQQQLENLDLVTFEVVPDGNCLFRSISFQVDGTQDNCDAYRQQCVDIMENDEEFFAAFVEDDEPFEDYLERMRTDGEWGSDKELIACSKLFGCGIVLHQLDLPMYVLSHPDNDLLSSEIHLSYHDEMHYNAVRHADADASGPFPLMTFDGSRKRYFLNQEGGVFEKATELQLTETKTTKKKVKKKKRKTKKERELPTEKVQQLVKSTGIDEKSAVQLLLDMDEDVVAAKDYLIATDPAAAEKIQALEAAQKAFLNV